MDPNQVGQALSHAALLLTLWLIFVGAVAIALGGTVVAVVVRLLFRPRPAASSGEPNGPNGAGPTIAVGSVAALLFLALGTGLFGAGASGGGSELQWVPAALTTSAPASSPTALTTIEPTASADSLSDAAVAPGGTPEPGTGADSGMVAPGGPASRISADGDYMVGADIHSGTWVSSGTTKCMWALTKYSDGGHPNPYRVYHANTQGSQTAHVRKTDAVFRTWGCGAWRRIAP